MERKDSLIKLRTCAVEQSFEHYDTWESATIISRIKSLSWIKTWCFIVHDKDINEDTWEPKKKHFHAVLTFENATTIWAIAKGLHVEPQFVEKIRTTTKTAQLYLVHRNDDKKYQYPPWEVIANFDYEKLVSESVPLVRKEDIAQKIAKWEIKEYNIFQYIDITEYAKNKVYYDRCFLFRQWLIKNMERNLECIYISWPSGCGKTTFAKGIARNYNYSYFVSSGGKNPLDDYKWQECIILDDLRDDVYTFAEILKISDNNTDSLVNCRFYNKSIAECKLLIITSIQDIQEFYKYECAHNDKEEQKQLFRRFKHYMKIDKDRISTYEYWDSFGWYVYCWDFENPITKMYDKKGWNSFFFNVLQQWMDLKSAGFDESKASEDIS